MISTSFSHCHNLRLDPVAHTPDSLYNDLIQTLFNHNSSLKSISRSHMRNSTIATTTITNPPRLNIRRSIPTNINSRLPLLTQTSKHIRLSPRTPSPGQEPIRPIRLRRLRTPKPRTHNTRAVLIIFLDLGRCAMLHEDVPVWQCLVTTLGLGKDGLLCVPDFLN